MTIEEIAIVVPSRNEARLLPRALVALEESMRWLALKFPDVRVSLTVVLDSSTDTSASILADHPNTRVKSIGVGRVGAARNTGITAAMSTSRFPPSRLWIANTDADSAVPPHWLERQYALAVAGSDVVVGTVEPFRVDLSEPRLAHWHAQHQLREGHSYVHGANLGFRADVFTSLGGFADIGLHEDRAFVTEAHACEYSIVATDSCRVRTAGRLQGRVEGGFAGFLAKLDISGDPDTQALRADREQHAGSKTHTAGSRLPRS
ncbi:glycosyltransferase [Arthrobacter roseus]|uniref:glycosyltransferase n=1 Tax=Arthrobacter roseus TaxID=136274 RepID=UPI0019636FD1|nr:glycosyltransferase [Arthrobacter roseus]MBM7848161.1 glycosyltransferase involved in cell wall biosynthesis [Arthrobacter roseus]